MTLDDLKDRWADYDRKLDAALRRDETRRRHDALAARAGGALRREGWAITLGQAANAIGVVALGVFISNHLDDWRFLVPAMLLDLSLIALILLGAWQQQAYRAIDFGDPVFAVQARLEQLRALRLHETRAVVLFAPLLWMPLLVVATKALLGIDAYAVFDPAWLWGNLAFGVAWIPFVAWLAHRGGPLRRSPRIARWLDAVAGHALDDVRRYLDALARD